MRSKRGHGVFGVIVALSLSAGLAACGGGGGGGDGGTTSSNGTSTLTAAPLTDGKLHAVSSGASNDTTYSGSGVGVWQALNAGAQSDTVNISLTGTAGRNVTLVFTDESTSSQTMSSVAINSNVVAASADVVSARTQALTGTQSGEGAGIAAIHEFNATGWKAIAEQNAATAALAGDVVKPVQRAAVIYSVGTTRSFWVSDGTSTTPTQRTMTLEKTGTTSDGTQVNVWVETGEYAAGKVTSAIVGNLFANYAGPGGIYDMVTGVGGPFWGTLNKAGMIGGSQPIDLVVANFNNDGKPYGTVGYFWALNNFVNKGTGTTTQYSNADLSLYLDSETLYLAGAEGMKTMQTVMAHESTHMQNYYRRDMLMGASYAYDTWLEEMTAMMMEDWVSFNIDATYNSVRDGRFPTYLTYNGHGSYTCGLTTWNVLGSSCDSYTTDGSFGGFLNRQLGLTFYKALLNDTKTSSLAMLNDAIQQVRSDSSVAQELRHFTVAASSQVPLAAGLAEYSFPGRTEGGFTLPSIDPSAMTRLLPSTSPSVLLSYASFPALRSHVGNTYQETVTLPPGVTVSVVVQ